MEKKAKQTIIGTAIAMLLILVAVSIVLVKKYTPSDERMELTEYYDVPEGEAMVIMDSAIYEKNALLMDGTLYMDLMTVKERFNHRFYWDSIENLLIYTTPSEVIKAEVGSKDYYVNKNKQSKDYAIVKTIGDSVYVALPFVDEYSEFFYEVYKEPERVVVHAAMGDYLYVTVNKNTQIRYEGNIKSDILADVQSGDTLLLIDAGGTDQKGFLKVMTADGVIGYVKQKYVSESFYDTVHSDYVQPVYSSISKDYTVNLVWHQVTNKESNSYMPDLISNTKGVTTISPTWYRINSTDGTLSSLASESYVEKAHNLGLEVWALVDNFDPAVDTYEVLSKSSSRERLVNELIAEAIKYNLDGINIDFENLSLETGPHFIQFIRELSVKCRSNQIVLSVDNYPPYSYNAFYDYIEQGKIVDYVIIMGYDEHHSNSETAGSVASIGYVNDAITNTLAKVDKEKVIMAVPFYTRLWKETTTDGVTSLTSEALGMNAAESVLSKNGVTPKWEESVAQYYAEYTIDDVLYKIWLEEDESLEAKMKAIHAADLAGVAGWRLGFEKSSIWNVIQKYVN